MIKEDYTIYVILEFLGIIGLLEILIVYSCNLMFFSIIIVPNVISKSL